MAEAYKNAYLDITNSAQDFYTCPGSTTAIVFSIRVTSVDGANSDSISADVVDSDGSTNARLASTILVPADSSLELCGQTKVVLQAGDKIKLQGVASSGDLEALGSILEIT